MEIFFEVQQFLPNTKETAQHIHRNKVFANILEILVDEELFYFSFFNYFTENFLVWAHHQLNLGLLASRNVLHEVPVYIQSTSPLSLYLQNVKVEIDNEDFQIHLVSFYKNGIALPFKNQSMLLLKILVSYNGTANFALLQGSLVAQLDVQNVVKEERLQFQAIYSPDLISLQSEEGYLVTKEQRNFKINIFQRTYSKMKFDYLVILGDEGQTEYYDMVRNQEIFLLHSMRWQNIYSIAFK